MVTPGLSGLAQVTGGYDLLPKEKVVLDLWWRGECGHVCQMAVRDRARAKPGYCPYCSGRKRPERPMRLD